MLAYAFGTLAHDAIGERIKEAFRLRGLSYQKAADKLNDAGVRDEHGIGLNKDRVASYALGRNRPPKWFLDGIVKELNLARDFFAGGATPEKTQTTAHQSSDTILFSQGGVRMRHVPLLHLWESARLHELMDHRSAWDGDRVAIPDFLELTELFGVRVESDGYGPVLERGDALVVHPNQPLRFDLDYLVTVKEGMGPDIARCVRHEGATTLCLLNGRRTVSAGDVYVEALVVGKLPQYNPMRPRGAFDPDGYLLPGTFPAS